MGMVAVWMLNGVIVMISKYNIDEVKYEGIGHVVIERY